MTITLNSDYDVTLNTALLGYVGETNARPVSVEGMEIDGADRYVLTIDYGDGVQYEVDITGGQWTPTADILRSAQTVSCQIAAKKLAGDEYILVKKSRIFRLRIGTAIGDNAIPSPDVAMDALDRIDAIGRQVTADMQTAVTAADTATTMANNAAKSATAAEKSADTATQAAKRAETAQASAETSATQAETARQGAETARAEAVTSQNNAKISAAQASATKVSTYVNANASAVIETVSVQEGSEGMSLGTADGTVSDLNHIHRARYGSNNWAESDLRMRLNSSAAPGGTWTRQSKFSRKPSWADTESGWLRGVDPDFLSVLGEVKKVTALNTLTDGGGSKTSTEKIFLLSRSEVYGSFENSVDEGAAYPYYKNYSDFASKNDGNDTNRIKHQSNGMPYYWWLRTPLTGYAHYVRNVFPTGVIDSSGAYGSIGLAPACCII